MKQLGPSEVGEMMTTPQVKNDKGAWVKAARPQSAKRWRARIYYGDTDGTRRSVQGYGRKQADAIAACEANLADRLRAQGHLKPSTPLSEAGNYWLEQIKRPDSNYSAGTCRDYERTFEAYFTKRKHGVWRLTLAQMNDTQRIRGFLQSVADEHGTQSAKIARSVLSGILGFAARNNVFDRNRVRDVERITSINKKESKRDYRRALTRTQRDELVTFAYKRVEIEGLNPRTVRERRLGADLTAFLAGTGARITEGRTMLQEDFNLETGATLIRGTKTSGSTRTVHAPDWLLQRMVERIELVGRGTYLFARPLSWDNSEIWEQSNAAKQLRDILDEAGFEWAIPHTFRRTVATLLDEAGAPLARVADWLGHRDPAMTASVYLGRDLRGDKSDLAGLL